MARRSGRAPPTRCGRAEPAADPSQPSEGAVSLTRVGTLDRGEPEWSAHREGVTGRRGWLATLAVALLAAGCGSGSASEPVTPSPTSMAWGHEAEQWFAAFDESAPLSLADPPIPWDQGPDPLARFFATDVVFDGSDVSGIYTVGRWSTLSAFRAQATDADLQGMEHGAIYLDVDGALRAETYTGPGGLDFGFLNQYVIGPSGITKIVSLSTTWFLPPEILGPYSLAGQAAADDLAAAYLTAWSGGDAAAVTKLYAEGATVVDALHGVAAADLPAITALTEATSVTLRPTSFGAIQPGNVFAFAPDATVADRPAVFFRLDPPRYGDLAQVAMFLHSTEDCPGAEAVVLSLDTSGRISAEQRFHALDSARACSNTAEMAAGWWTGNGLPTPIDERVTGRLETAAGSIEVRNGSPVLDAQTSAAVQRFNQAGIGVPKVSSITFNPYDPACERKQGTITWSDQTVALLVCADGSEILDAEAACRDDPGSLCITSAEDIRHAVMHELAHAWLADHADPATRKAFMARVGLTSWDDAGTPWQQRGFEWATETLVWGLNREALTPVRLGSPTCTMLRGAFLTLTGKAPLQQCT